MDLANPQHLRTFLQEEGLRPQRRFSQNFLVDGQAVKRIIEEVTRGQPARVLEIGPGPGVLTEALLSKGCTVHAVELDVGMAAALRRRAHPRLTVIHGDALAIPLEPILAEGVEVVVGNLPYAITAPLLGRYLLLHPLVRRVVVMVQWEVAQRMLASPRSKQWGLLSLFVQAYSQPSLVCKVPSVAFRPRPNVDSAVVSLELQTPAQSIEEAMAWARRAFQQRRKMLRASLGRHVDRVILDRAFQQADIRPEQRPEELSLAQWLRLARQLAC